MNAEGVMVSYNYSEDEEDANILTVSASGIKFSNRWVLTHGSILSPLKQARIIQNAKGKPILSEEFYNNLPEIYVTCEKTKKNDGNLYDAVEQLSRERHVDGDDFEHSTAAFRHCTSRQKFHPHHLDAWLSTTVRFSQIFLPRTTNLWNILMPAVFPDQYDPKTFKKERTRSLKAGIAFVILLVLQVSMGDGDYLPSGEHWTIGHRDGDVQAQTQLGKALLSVFVLVDLESDNRALKTLRPLSELLDIVRPPPQRGSTIEIHSTPFGCEAFLNAVTRGSICGVVGKKPSLLLADAATALGSEGGPVFTEGPTNELIGTVVCSVSWWRGEWVGLTLAAPLVSVLAAKLRVTPQRVPRPLTSNPNSDILDRVDKTTVLVRCGSAWGAGVWLGAGLLLTAAHVVRNYTGSKVSIFCGGVKETAIVRYKTTDDRAFDLAVLYTNPEQWRHLKAAVFADQPAEKGESVLAAGYPYFNEKNLEDLRPTVTSGHINTVSPSMLQTSCCIQSGFSGGPIFRLNKNSVEVLGIIVSNTKTHSGACYPYINMAVPATAFKGLLHEFALDKGMTKMLPIPTRTKKFGDSFLCRTIRKWDALPAHVFSPSYNLGSFKRGVKKQHAGRQDRTAVSAIFASGLHLHLTSAIPTNHTTAQQYRPITRLRSVTRERDN
ncbi:hypothetical protein evm_006184 [Chilo suppressalis]|nr:hypothetical protein evm_006184 [Chilo suppressalis]